jgi:hypothetical protein
LTSFDSTQNLSRIASTLHPEHLSETAVHGFKDSARSFYEYLKNLYTKYQPYISTGIDIGKAVIPYVLAAEEDDVLVDCTRMRGILRRIISELNPYVAVKEVEDISIYLSHVYHNVYKSQVEFAPMSQIFNKAIAPQETKKGLLN